MNEPTLHPNENDPEQFYVGDLQLEDILRNENINLSRENEGNLVLLFFWRCF